MTEKLVPAEEKMPPIPKSNLQILNVILFLTY